MPAIFLTQKWFAKTSPVKMAISMYWKKYFFLPKTWRNTSEAMKIPNCSTVSYLVFVRHTTIRLIPLNIRSYIPNLPAKECMWNDSLRLKINIGQTQKELPTARKKLPLHWNTIPEKTTIPLIPCKETWAPFFSLPMPLWRNTSTREEVNFWKTGI